MEDRQKSDYRQRLLAMLESLEDVRELSASSQAIVELDQQAVGRLSRMDAMQQQAMAKATETNRLTEIGRIRAALQRLDEDEFGFCAECGEEIAPKRMELSPTVLTCISCARGG